MNMVKHIKIGMLAGASVWVIVTLKDSAKHGSEILSITGVHNPRSSGDCRSCGQIIDVLSDPELIHDDPEISKKLADVWKRWHLNDMCSGQEYSKGWQFEALPGDVKEFLTGLPNHYGLAKVWQ